MTAIALAVAVVQLFIAPLVLLPIAPTLTAIAVIGLSLTVPFSHALMHEAIHGRLATPSRLNDWLGRALAMSSAVVFDGMRFGHLSHHRYNRHSLDRPDIIQPGASGLLTGLRYYGGLLGGIYLIEVGGSLAMLLPRPIIDRLLDRTLDHRDPALAAIRRAMQRSLDRRLTRMRVDVSIVLFLFAVAFALYGADWPILAGAIVVRGLILSIMDNAPHYGTPPVIGADAHNTRAGRWLSAFLLNQNLHAVHHHRPELPWTALPVAFDQDTGRHHGGYCAGLLRQFGGPWRPKDPAMVELHSPQSLEPAE